MGFGNRERTRAAGAGSAVAPISSPLEPEQRSGYSRWGFDGGWDAGPGGHHHRGWGPGAIPSPVPAPGRVGEGVNRMRRLRSSICPAWGTDSPHPSCELRPRSCPGPGTVRPERVVPPRFAEPRGAVPGPGSDCPPRRSPERCAPAALLGNADPWSGSSRTSGLAGTGRKRVLSHRAA